MIERNLVVLAASSDIGKVIVDLACRSSPRRVLAVTRSANRAMVDASTPSFQALDGIDLTQEVCLGQLREKVASFFDQPFTVVHCAGDFWSHKPFDATSFGEVRRMIDSHFTSFCGAVHALLPVMKRVGGGRFVAFSCNSVQYNYPDMAPFTASKAALEACVKCLANEHSESGISALALALPTILTAKVKAEKPQGDPAHYITAQEVAEYVLHTVLSLPHEMSGNVIKVFRHSPTFYHKSYYDRNPGQPT